MQGPQALMESSSSKHMRNLERLAAGRITGLGANWVALMAESAQALAKIAQLQDLLGSLTEQQERMVSAAVEQANRKASDLALRNEALRRELGEAQRLAEKLQVKAIEAKRDRPIIKRRIS